MTIQEKTNVKTAMNGYISVNKTLHALYPAVFFNAALSSSLFDLNSGECFIMCIFQNLICDERSMIIKPILSHLNFSFFF